MEEWRAVPGYEGWYEVSSYGRVRGIDRVIQWSSGRMKGVIQLRKGKFLKIHNNPYSSVRLTKNGKTINKSVHRLVAEAFIPNSDNKPQVNHIDGDKNNNHVDNLEWCTAIENIHHTMKKGKYCYGEKHGMCELTEDDVIVIEQSRGYLKDVAKQFGISTTHVSDIRNHKIWRYLWS